MTPTDQVDTEVPPPSRKSKLAWGAFAVIGGISAAQVRDATDMWFPSLIVAGLAWAVILGHRAISRSSFKDPVPPLKPVLVDIPLRRLPEEPPRKVYEESDVCVICGRPLTRGDSRQAHVGSTCIRTFGPRFKMVENPQWTGWTELAIEARAEQAERRAEAQVAHDRKMVEWELATLAWQAELDSPAGLARLTARDRIAANYGPSTWLLPLTYIVALLI